jgi:hypothetical protein
LAPSARGSHPGRSRAAPGRPATATPGTSVQRRGTAH